MPLVACRQSPGNAPAHDTTVAVAQQTIYSRIDVRALLDTVPDYHVDFHHGPHH